MFAFAALLYANTLGHGFALDDAIVITDNDIVRRGPAGWGELFTTDTFYGFFGEEGKDRLVAGGRYRPLTPAMFSLERALSPGPLLHHLGNVLWYALLTVVLFYLLRRAAAGRKLAWWFPLLGAALFAAHPVHTEVVANIKGRDEIIALLGSLAATWAVWTAADRRHWGWAAAGGGAFLLGCLAKENAITFLGVIPLVLWALRRGRFRAGDLAYFGPVVAAGGVFLAIRFGVVGLGLGEPVRELMNNPFLKRVGEEWIPMTTGERLATVFYTLWEYLRLLFVPVGLVHDYYPAAVEMKSWSSPGALLGLATHAGGAVLGFLLLRPRPLIGVGILAYLLTLSIVSNLFFSVGTFMSERFLFAPSVGFVLALVGGVAGAAFSKKPPVPYALLALTAVFAALTVLRNPVWRDNYTLFTTDVERQPRSAKLLNAAGGVLVDTWQALPETRKPVRKQMLIDARDYLDRAVEIHPTYANAYLLRGNALLLLDEYNDAIADYDRALELNPGYTPAADNLVLALTTAGRAAGEQYGDLQSSMYYLQRALQLAPNDYEALRLMGVAQGMSGQPAQALGFFERAMAQRPEDADAIWNYGTALYQLGRTAEAEAAFARAEAVRPGIRGERGGAGVGGR